MRGRAARQPARGGAAAPRCCALRVVTHRRPCRRARSPRRLSPSTRAPPRTDSASLQSPSGWLRYQVRNSMLRMILGVGGWGWGEGVRGVGLRACRKQLVASCPAASAPCFPPCVTQVTPGQHSLVERAAVRRHRVLAALEQVVERRHVDLHAAAVALAREELADVDLACGEGLRWVGGRAGSDGGARGGCGNPHAAGRIQARSQNRRSEPGQPRSTALTGRGRRELAEAVGVAHLELALIP
jgi:hypothetical protein